MPTSQNGFQNREKVSSHMALVLEAIKHFYGHLEVPGVKKKFHLFTLSSFLFVVVVVVVVASVIIYAPFEQKTDGKKIFLTSNNT